MDEIQDAIEDAQYIMAMQDDTPHPTQPWKKPTPEQLKAYHDQLNQVTNNNVDMEYYLSGSLGFYLFVDFLKGTPDKIFGEFLSDTSIFRAKISPSLAIAAEQIIKNYMKDYSTGNGMYKNLSVSQESSHSSHVAGKKGSKPNQVEPASMMTTRKVNFRSRPSETKRQLVKKVDEMDIYQEYIAAEDRLPSEELKKANSKLQSTVEDDDETQETRDLRLTMSSDASSLNIELVAPPPLSVEKCQASKVPKEVRLGVWKKFLQTGARNILTLSSDQVDKINALVTQSQLSWGMFDEVDEIVFQYLNSKYFEAFSASPQCKKFHDFMCMMDYKMTEDDFRMFRPLGRGGYGMVFACKRCVSGKLYAVKTMGKKRIKMKKAESLVINEKQLLASIDSKYIVCLKYSFQTPRDVFLVLDVMTGGDLGYHLHRTGKFSITECKYYTARILLGLGALHAQSIAFRDLKPDNILMDEKGRTKLSDLGLACYIGPNGMVGQCGTRGYWAPEMLRKDKKGKRERYTVTVDYFSLGCVLYEFMTGHHAFKPELCFNLKDDVTDPEKVFDIDITKLNIERPKHPDEVAVWKKENEKAVDRAILDLEPDYTKLDYDPAGKDLVQQLLKKSGKERLGAKGVEEIMRHEFFKGIDFNTIDYDNPPYKPSKKEINATSQSDIGHFADEAQSEKLTMTEDDQKIYKDWQFVSPQSYQAEIVEFFMYEDALGPIAVEDYGSSCCTLS